MRGESTRFVAHANSMPYTWARHLARGPDDMHVGSAAQTRIYWLTCASKSKRACSGVYVRTCTRPCKSASISQRTNARQFRQSADRIIQNHRFLAVFTQWVCSSAATPPQVSGSLPPNGGNGVIRGTTRRRHAVRRLCMAQNPHRHQWRARCRGREGLAAAPAGGGGAWPGFETTRQHAKRRRCGGRRRVRRARPRRPWAAAGPGRADTHRYAQRPGPTGVEGAGGSGGHGRASRRGAERSEAA